jgi:hypothetical protein
VVVDRGRGAVTGTQGARFVPLHVQYKSLSPPHPLLGLVHLIPTRLVLAGPRDVQTALAVESCQTTGEIPCAWRWRWCISTKAHISTLQQVVASTKVLDPPTARKSC